MLKQVPPRSTTLVSCVLAALAFVAACARSQDDDPFGAGAPGVVKGLVWVDDQRLALPEWAPEVPDPNAFGAYRAAAALCSEARPDMVLVEEWGGAVLAGDMKTARVGLPAMQAVVARTQTGLEMLHEAAGREYLDPGGRTFETPLPWLAEYRTLARFARATALVAFLEGDYGTAFARIEDVYALGVSCPRGGTLIDLLVGQAILKIADETDAFLVLEPGALASELASHARRLAEFRARFPSLADTALVEGHAVLDALRAIEDEDDLADLLALAADDGVEESLRGYGMERLSEVGVWLEDRFARIVAALREPWGSGTATEVLERASSDAEAASDPVLRAIVAWPVRVYDRHVFAYGCLAGAEASAAVEAYRRDKGAYPESLEALCPEYLPAVPVDPCSGRGLCYALTDTGYTIYSVGVNGTDDGGTGVPPRRDMGSADIVFVPLR